MVRNFQKPFTITLKIFFKTRRGLHEGTKAVHHKRAADKFTTGEKKIPENCDNSLLNVGCSVRIFGLPNLSGSELLWNDREN